ncbi:hypothetical protein F4775DRAFT_271400 [Biscogniauxia sp. FL1348]|nr:hypothetical protein F4775DRAFT_271400 [Biscogniauxia sp. FL1348]
MASRPAAVSQPEPSPPLEITKENFKPCYMFFYGTLMDKEMLQVAAGLSSAPELRPATITGWQLKMWGPYPTLVPASTSTTPSSSPGLSSSSPPNTTTTAAAANKNNTHDNKVHGVAWELKTYAQLSNLQEYESSHYRPSACVIRAEGEGGAGEWEGLTFVWAGDPSSPELEDGSFDLEFYQRTTKKYMFGG